jgi:hypothetical protein
MTPPHFTFLWLSSLWRGPGPLFEQIWIPFTQGIFVPSLIDFGLLFLEKKIFKNFQRIFTLSLLSPLGDGLSPSFEQNLIPSFQGWFVPSLVKIGPVILEKTILKWPLPIFIYFFYYLPYEKDLALYLYKLEFPSPKDNLYQVWLNLACWFWRRF